MFTNTPSSGGGASPRFGEQTRWQHTGVKLKGTRQMLSFFSRGMGALPSIRRELLSLTHHGDINELRLSFWTDQLYDLVSAYTFCRLSEGLFAAIRLRGPETSAVALVMDWLLWFATTWNTSQSVNAFANRFDSDTLPDLILAVFNILTMGLTGLAAHTIESSMLHTSNNANSAHTITIGSQSAFFAAVIVSRLGMLAALIRVALRVDPSAAGYCVLRGAQVFLGACGFLGLLFEPPLHSGLYFVLWIVTLGVDSVSLKSVSCCHALLYSNYVQINVQHVSERMSHTVWLCCGVLLVQCFAPPTMGAAAAAVAAALGDGAGAGAGAGEWVQPSPFRLLLPMLFALTLKVRAREWEGEWGEGEDEGEGVGRGSGARTRARAVVGLLRALCCASYVC